MIVDFIPVMRFLVCSDSHIEGVDSQGFNRLKSAVDLAFDIADGCNVCKKLDAVLLAGDITDSGTKAEFDAFKIIFDYVKSRGTEFLSIVAKGHDSISLGKGSLKYFSAITNQETDFHVILNGFHFIGLSTSSIPEIYYSPAQRYWLMRELDKAVSTNPGRPVFLMHHEHVKYTVYGSGEVDGWGHDFFTEMLKKYPSVVDFSGHSHYPLNDPRSLWQNEYTAVGTGSLKYTELTVDGERKIRPDNKNECGSFWLAELDAEGNLHLSGFDCDAQKVLCEYYIANPSDKNNREYTQEKMCSKSTPPVFFENSFVAFSDGRISFKRADETDGMPIFIYRIFVVDENEKTVAKTKVLPSYYLFNKEEVLTAQLPPLPFGRYKIKICAETVYGVASEFIQQEITI